MPATPNMETYKARAYMKAMLNFCELTEKTLQFELPNNMQKVKALGRECLAELDKPTPDYHKLEAMGKEMVFLAQLSLLPQN
jgi:hypothetical protein